MRTRVKICGITNMEDALQCVRLGADALGFILYPPSPRHVPPATVRDIISSLPPYISTVGVFVNQPLDQVLRIIECSGVGTAQLSGDESPEFCSSIPVRTIKVFRQSIREHLDRISDFATDAIMLDGAPDGEYGGSGIRADLNLALALKRYAPLMLAGGLNPHNVVEAISTVRPFAVDLNSGVELSPGKKDIEKLTLVFDRISTIHLKEE